MKKVLALLVIMLVLTACTKSSLADGFNSGLTKPTTTSTNHKKNYYRYYLPPHAGVKKSDQTSSLLMVERQHVLLSLSVDKIVSDKFEYDKSDDKIIVKEPVFEDSASYIDIVDKNHVMTIRIYQLENDYYAVILNNEQVELTSIVPKTHLKIVSDTMVGIIKSVVVDKEAVVLAYSNKELSTYDSTYSEFFEQTPPEAGTIKDMYEQLNPNKN